MKKDTSATPKLSCKHVWKLYGPNAERHLDGGLPQDSDAAKGLAQNIRDQGGIVASADVSFDVFEGEIFVIMGLSGSGKSTIVRCLSRLVQPSAGEIWLDGQDLLKATGDDLISFRRHKMGMVFQNFGLMPHLNVLENVAFPLKLQGMSVKERQARAQQVIEKVGLVGREAAFPAQLSGGQQQRVGIARSLAVEPEVWFLDEPFSALDPLIRRQMQDEFLRLQGELNKSIVFITHDFLEALRIADRMAIMKDGEVVQIGKPVDLILRPANDYVREFTKDVPWEMVLTAGDVASLTPPPEGILTVEATQSLAEILPHLAAHEDGVAVQSQHGLGHLTARDVVTALAGGVGKSQGTPE